MQSLHYFEYGGKHIIISNSRFHLEILDSLGLGDPSCEYVPKCFKLIDFFLWPANHFAGLISGTYRQTRSSSKPETNNLTGN